MKPPRVYISDHALLRYLERVQGVDVHGARRRLERAMRKPMALPGASGVVVDGFVLKLKHHEGGITVATVVRRNGHG